MDLYSYVSIESFVRGCKESKTPGTFTLHVPNLLYAKSDEIIGYGLSLLRRSIVLHEEQKGIGPELSKQNIPFFRENRRMLIGPEVEMYALSLYQNLEIPSGVKEKDTSCLRLTFDYGDSRILVDLHKMTDGRQSAVTMAAYLPQPKPGETFAEIAPLPAQTPTEYADLIFDKIEDIVRANDKFVSIARTPADLYADKHNGRKSIMLGIENGLALNGDIRNVEHFAKRGVVYITLCHNGDNDICDSARRTENTHGGVSQLGEQVIREMNRCGLMVDLSHAGEQSFYDALDISATPIVCSHSNCKALCDVPRNLTDDQLEALARKGGVAQITLYNGFLRNDDQEASIIDAIDHLEHAIDIMGIDSVGIGTDFDGDGGVCGIADSSELINFTIQLLRRRYSHADIEKIWGGNWLRVMAEVQKSRIQ